MVTSVRGKARKQEIDKEPRDHANVKEAWKMNWENRKREIDLICVTGRFICCSRDFSVLEEIVLGDICAQRCLQLSTFGPH